MMSEQTESNISTLVLYLVGPMLVLTAFQREFSYLALGSFVRVLAISFVSILGSSLLARKTLRVKDSPGANDVLCSSVTFKNCGIIGLALQNALFGSDGVFLGVAYCTAFNVLLWSYGVIIFNRTEKLKPKKILLNPGTVGMYMGLALFFSSTVLPNPFYTVVENVGNMNTPLSMLVIGCRMSHIRLRDLFKGDAKIWLCSLEGLMIVPAIVAFLMYIVGMRGMEPMVLLISIGGPAAAYTSMFAIQYNREPLLSAKIVSLQTFLSLITMPIFLSCAAQLFLKT